MWNQIPTVKENKSKPTIALVRHLPPMYAWAKRLDQKMKDLGWSKADLAREANVNYDTVNKCLRGDVENPRGDTMKRLAVAVGESEIWLRHGKTVDNQLVNDGISMAYKRTVSPPHKTSLPSSQGQATRGLYETLSLQVPVIGQVQAGAWMEAQQLPEAEWTRMSLPADRRYPGVQRIAWVSAGNSMNKAFPDGSTLVAVRYQDIGEEPQSGHLVIVEREDQGGRVEATCKRFSINGDNKPLLSPESTDQIHKPISLVGGRNIKEIRVIARVIMVVSPVP